MTIGVPKREEGILAEPVAQSANSAGEASFWRLSRLETRVAVAALLLSVVARWQALLPAYSIDDFGLVNEETSELSSLAMAQGRALAYVLKTALIRLDVLPHSAVLSSVLLMLVLVGVGIVVCRLWGIRNRAAECTIAVLFLTLHPYQAEIFTFKTAAIFLAIPLALSFFAISTCAHSPRHWLLSTIVLISALFLYQAVLNYIAMALLFSMVFHLARGVEERSLSFWSSFKSQLMLVFVSVVLYALLALAIAGVARVPIHGRATLIGAPEIAPRIIVSLAQLRMMFVQTEPILPSTTKLLMILAPLVALGVSFFSMPGRALRLTFSRRAFPYLLIIIVGVPLCLGVILVLHEWWPVPRVLAHIGIFWAGIYALSLRLASPRGRHVLVAAAGVIVFSFIGINNHIFNDQVRLNMRDMAKANRIIMRVEALPDFDRITGIVITGGYWSYPSPIKTLEGDMNVSALFAAWSKTPVINEVSGYKLSLAPEQIAENAKAYCRSSPKWPAPQSVTTMKSFAVVCLAN